MEDLLTILVGKEQHLDECLLTHYTPPRQLHSVDQHLLCEPHTKSVIIVERTFHKEAPTL